ncbi:chaperonin 10-like protein [Mycena latifolia]|nr:chaperonin 10-like protein [Mycena latifolia]
MTPTTMLAAVYHPGNNNLVLDKKYPIRPLKEDEVLLKVSACGVCHTDVAILSGATADTRTYIVGHEIAGVPVLLGPQGGKSITLGKLYSVLLSANAPAGGSVALDTLGLGVDGGFAEYVIVQSASLILVPDGVSPEVAAIASDAGVTSYHAVKNTAGVTQGSKVLIFGIGGLGYLAVQYAKHLGATAFTLAMAALKGNEVKFPVVSKLVMQVGFSAENLVFMDGATIASGVQILSSAYSSQPDLEEVLDLFAKSERLANVNKVINELRSFQITGRKVVVPE